MYRPKRERRAEASGTAVSFLYHVYSYSTSEAVEEKRTIYLYQTIDGQICSGSLAGHVYQAEFLAAEQAGTLEPVSPVELAKIVTLLNDTELQISAN